MSAPLNCSRPRTIELVQDFLGGLSPTAKLTIRLVQRDGEWLIERCVETGELGVVLNGFHTLMEPRTKELLIIRTAQQLRYLAKMERRDLSGTKPKPRPPSPEEQELRKIRHRENLRKRQKRWREKHPEEAIKARDSQLAVKRALTRERKRQAELEALRESDKIPLEDAQRILAEALLSKEEPPKKPGWGEF